MASITKGFKNLQPYLVLLLVAVLALKLAWTGFVSSDDAYYVQAGAGWLHHFPYVGEHFGTIRATVAIPIAAMFYFFGENEVSAVLSTSLFLVLTALLTFKALKDIVGTWPAVLAGIALLTTPLFALKSTIPCADLPELFFVTLSFWLFWYAINGAKPRIGILIGTGVSAGLAFSAHEVTSALLLFYGLLFLINFRIPRLAYLWIVAGFVLVLVGESVYYGLVAGNPLHRFQLLLQGTSVNDRSHVGFMQIASGGTIHIWEPIDPIVMILTHHDFALLGWLVMPPIIWVIKTRNLQPTPQLTLARLSLGLGVVWFLFSALMLTKLILLPRYYMVSAYFFLVLVTLWMAIILWQRRGALTIVLILFALAANVLSITLDNKNPRFAERALVAYLKSNDGLVHTDPLTAHNASWFCHWQKVDCQRIVIKSPGPGDVYFWNPRNTDNPNRLVSQSQLAKYRPLPTWKRIGSFEQPPAYLSSLAKTVGIDRGLPAFVYKKFYPKDGMTYVFLVN